MTDPQFAGKLMPLLRLRSKPFYIVFHSVAFSTWHIDSIGHTIKLSVDLFRWSWSHFGVSLIQKNARSIRYYKSFERQYKRRDHSHWPIHHITPSHTGFSTIETKIHRTTFLQLLHVANSNQTHSHLDHRWTQPFAHSRKSFNLNSSALVSLVAFFSLLSFFLSLKAKESERVRELQRANGLL